VNVATLRRGLAILRSARLVPVDVIVGRLWPADSTFRLCDHSRPTGEVSRESCPQRGPPPTPRELMDSDDHRPLLRRYSSHRGRGTQHQQRIAASFT
jgi:hypothetical protein